MQKEIPSVRIWPMSSQIPGFRGRDIADVQKNCFLKDVFGRGGKFRYRSSGLNAPAGSVILFQYQAHIIASAVFERDERFAKPLKDHAGELHFEAGSIRVFKPLDLAAMREVWPRFRAFGHVKQYLNPECYADFIRRLKRVASPVKRKLARDRNKRVEVQR